MTQLYFRYSEIYEYMLAQAAGEKLSDEEVKSGYVFADTYIKYWEQYNTPIFEYYKNLGFVTPDFWVAYFIHSRKRMTPFSDPLTLFIKENLDELTAVLVHELGHVMLSYGPNSALYQKLMYHLQKTYPNHDFGTNIEIMTILLARWGLIKIFGEEKTEKLLAIEKTYPSLKKAWEVIDSQPDVLNAKTSIDSIYALK